MRDRFLRRVDRSPGPASCHPWIGGSSSGYGTFSIGGQRYFAHRIACAIEHGPPPDPGLYACHSNECTTRRCVNGRHLRWDTQSSNIRDAVSLGKMRGENCARASLTEEQAKEIWALRQAGMGPAAIATAVGVGVHAVSSIVRGRTWHHVTGVPVYVPLAKRTAPPAPAPLSREVGL